MNALLTVGDPGFSVTHMYLLQLANMHFPAKIFLSEPCSVL